MRATIDSAKCMGHGMCYSLAPNVFTDDDQGYGHVIGEGIGEGEVPPAQAESMAADLSAHGIRHALLTFKGESHGFRKAETLIACLEAELAFYGEVLSFATPGIPPLPLTTLSETPEPAVVSEAAN